VGPLRSQEEIFCFVDYRLLVSLLVKLLLQADSGVSRVTSRPAFRGTVLKTCVKSRILHEMSRKFPFS
jgi:hypothetical protein